MTKSLKLARFLSVAVLTAAFSLHAWPGIADEKTGIVLMHGKGGACIDSSPCGRLKSALLEKGYLVDAPVMPWGKNRIYDKDVAASMAEIEGLVAGLRAQGAARVVLAGHSMGANAAFGYILDHPDIAGGVMLAARHQPENPMLQKKGLAEGVANAKSMIDAGKGDEMGSFIDFNTRPQPPARTTANIYYSWFAPDGPASMMNMAQRYAGTPPVLWIDSQTELEPRMKFRQRLAALMKDRPGVTFQVVDSDHFGAPEAAVPAVLAWLDGLGRATAAPATPAAATPVPAQPAALDEPVGPSGRTPSQVMKGSDKNGDGKLSAAEFRGPASAFERIDANADGFLTKQELTDAWR